VNIGPLFRGAQMFDRARQLEHLYVISVSGEIWRQRTMFPIVLRLVVCNYYSSILENYLTKQHT